MHRQEFLTEEFEAHRSHPRPVADRMLGSTAQADDAVQESWFRLARADTSGVDNLGGWLAFLAAARGADFDALVSLLAPDAVLRADAVAVAGGATGEVCVAAAVAETVADRARVAPPALVDGAAGAVWAQAGLTRVVFDFTIVDSRIARNDLVMDPESIEQLDVVVGDAQ